MQSIAVAGVSLMINRQRLRYLLLLVLLSGIGTAWYWRDSLTPEALNSWLEQLGWIAPLALVASIAFASRIYLRKRRRQHPLNP